MSGLLQRTGNGTSGPRSADPGAPAATVSAGRRGRAAVRRHRSVAFVLASYQPNAANETGAATGTMAAALRTLGHRAFVITARPQPPSRHVVRLATLPVAFPCDTQSLRHGVQATADWLRREMTALTRELGVDTVVHVGPLWGLGRAMPDQTRRVLVLSETGRDEDLRAAIANQPDAVIAQSPNVAAKAGSTGYDSSSWRVVPNLLLACPGERSLPPPAERERLRTRGPIRVIGDVSAVQNMLELLSRAGGLARRVDLMPADTTGEDIDLQREELAACEAAARRIPLVRLHQPIGWRQLPGWLAEAAVVVLPSTHTVGALAVEAMAAGSPVVGYASGNLPELVASAGILVPPGDGPEALLRTARELTENHTRYARRSRDAHLRAGDFRPLRAADRFMKGVR